LPFRFEPTCRPKDAPISLRGPWLGILGVDGRTGVDLLPPYDLTMRVEDASDDRYEGALLTIHVTTDVEELLDRDDVRTSLWEGGSLVVSAACGDEEFVALSVSGQPPSSTTG
jgi:hypothetical protein